MSRIPDFKQITADKLSKLSEKEIFQIFEKAEIYDLLKVYGLKNSLIFPHLSIDTCGHFTAAVVNTCLNSGADRILVIGTLHALTDKLNNARIRVSNGSDPSKEEFYGIQGPGIEGRVDWKKEFSLDNFLFLFDQAVKFRGIKAPELIIRYPYLSGGHPENLPGIKEVAEISKDAFIVATMDPFHHGIGYGDNPESALEFDIGGKELATNAIREGLDILDSGNFWKYDQHCVDAKSDGRDVGQLLRYLTGSMKTEIIDIVGEDMSIQYRKSKPTWVAGALIGITTR